MNGAGKADLFGTPIIDHFRDEYRFLSNFYIAPVTVWDITFPTSEHAYQWVKTNDPEEKHTVLYNIVEASNGNVMYVPTTAGQAKRAGNKVTKREDWEVVRYRIMLELQYAKFTQNPELTEKLVATGDALIIEGNSWCDNTWGACDCVKCINKEKQNLLGKALMQLRDALEVIGQGRAFALVNNRNYTIPSFESMFPA